MQCPSKSQQNSSQILKEQYLTSYRKAYIKAKKQKTKKQNNNNKKQYSQNNSVQ